MKKIEFDLYPPRFIRDVFIVPPDESAWDVDPRYIKQGQNYVPNRRHVFSSNEFLLPLNSQVETFFGQESDTNYGIYILIFPAFGKFYVGVAARFSRLVKTELKTIKSPEGIFERLCKHRAKCTGSYSSINHTDANGRGWRTFALERYEHHKKLGVCDTMDDCLLSIINFKDHSEHSVDDKGLLEKLENWLSNCRLTPIFEGQYQNLDPLAHTTNKQMDFAPIFSHRDLRF